MRERVGILNRKMNNNKKVEYTVDLKESKMFLMNGLIDRVII